MRVRFQADADFNQDIVRAVHRRAPAVDFQTAHEAGLGGLDDDVEDLMLIWEASEAEEWVNQIDSISL
jgi:hypothetical protein